ncbi:hypothetical protein [Paraburkholderia dilworthii]|uniref:hypothetical protein n=1 Tax=Paraburkholderia dilworthii TaxID=948106 RepID=UPI001427E45B|nr:hypothetical protein [Paraburkholderia dilworthii]
MDAVRAVAAAHRGRPKEALESAPWSFDHGRIRATLACGTDAARTIDRAGRLPRADYLDFTAKNLTAALISASEQLEQVPLGGITL